MGKVGRCGAEVGGINALRLGRISAMFEICCDKTVDTGSESSGHYNGDVTQTQFYMHTHVLE